MRGVVRFGPTLLAGVVGKTTAGCVGGAAGVLIAECLKMALKEWGPWIDKTLNLSSHVDRMAEVLMHGYVGRKGSAYGAFLDTLDHVG